MAVLVGAKNGIVFLPNLLWLKIKGKRTVLLIQGLVLFDEGSHV